MAETDEDELTRLELLSNTAMLKKLMDKEGDDKKEETKVKAAPALTVSMPQTRLEDSSSEKEGDNSCPSPHWGMDSVHRRSHFRFASIPTHPYGFNTARDNSQCPSQQAEGGTYAINWSAFYGRNTREILYSPDQIRSPQRMMPVRPQYSMKENLPPSRYLDSSTYSDSAGVGIQASGFTFHPTGGIPNSFKGFGLPSPTSSYDSILAQNHHLREQLQERDFLVSSLQQRLNHLENQIIELRQLPTGKVSHIPIDDMVKIMEEYGSEVSDQTLPMRKEHIKKTSIIRQFRRWNPTFFNYFVHANGEWVPKLGKEGELRRREEKRKMMKKQQGYQQG